MICMGFIRPFNIKSGDLLGGSDTTSDQRWEMLDALFEMHGPSLIALAIMVTSYIGWSQSHAASFALWGGTAFAVLCYRLAVSQAYRNRPPAASQISQTQTWARQYFWSCALSGVQLGLGALCFFDAPSSHIEVGILVITSIALAGGTARAFLHPGAVIIQTLICSAAIIAYYAYTDQWVIAIVDVFYVVFLISFTRSLSAIKLRQMKTDRERDELLVKLGTLAETDPLTGVANRRRFDDVLRTAWREAETNGEPLSVILFDIDHFKAFNDGYGHQAGDACLSVVAATVNEKLPPGAILARYGGEEFAVLLGRTSEEQAEIVAWRMVSAVRKADLSDISADDLKVTVSAGVAGIIPTEVDRIAQLIERSDRALYAAKGAGRDTVRVFHGMTPCSKTSDTPVSKQVA